MADYPHASAACLCYLDGREGDERGRKQGCWTFNVFSLSSRCPARLSTQSCWPFEFGKRKKEIEGRGWAAQAVQSRSWTSPWHFKALSGVNCCGLLHSQWRAFPSQMTVAWWQSSIGIGWTGEEGGGTDQSRTIVMVLFRGKSLFVPGLFKPTPGSSQSKWDF